jgi:hypothetical protein
MDWQGSLVWEGNQVKLYAVVPLRLWFWRQVVDLAVDCGQPSHIMKQRQTASLVSRTQTCSKQHQNNNN